LLIVLPAVRRFIGIIERMSLSNPETFESETGSVRFVQIAAAQQGQRIDNFLLRTLKGVPKSKIYRILRSGEVRVNSARIKPEYRLQTGDRVRIPPLRTRAQTTPVRPPQVLLEQLRSAVLFEDRELLVIDKPAGLAVHKGSGLAFGVIEILRALRPQAEFLELVHRLDRATSGCLLIAKSPQMLKKLHAALHSGAVDKRYLALVKGHWDHGTIEVTAPLRKNTLRGGERMVVVSESGKAARSRFQAITITPQASLLEVRIATGRTHQIRVHAAYVQHPVAGDDKYGDDTFNRQMSQLGLNRLFLHAHSLSVDIGGRDIAVSTPLDDGLKKVLDRLG
jgi:23S rRNA pseudouridine955/2504/2580 synthase